MFRVQTIGAQRALEWSQKALCKNWDVLVALKDEQDLSEDKEEMRVLSGRENGVNRGMKVRLIKVCLWATEFAWQKQRVRIENKENKFGFGGRGQVIKT